MTKIQTKQIEGEQYWKVATRLELFRVVNNGGWKSSKDFLDDMGVSWLELKGKWFTVIKGMVFIK